MALRAPLGLRTRLQVIHSRYPSTWKQLCQILQELDSWQVLLAEYLDPDGNQLSVGRTRSIRNAADALLLWERGSCTLDELLRVLTNNGLYEAVALLHRNLLNNPDYRPPLPPTPQLPPPTTPPPPTPQMLPELSDPVEFPADTLKDAIAQGTLICNSTYADIYRVKVADRDLAVKAYHPANSEEVCMAVLRSSHALTRLRHDCIARLVGFTRCAEGRFYTVLEHYPNGDLRQLLNDFHSGSCPETSRFQLEGTRLRMAIELTGALEYLHAASDFSRAQSGGFASFHYVHRDVKPNNILLSADWHCHLADLDFLDLTTQGSGQTSFGEKRQDHVVRVHSKGYAPDDENVTCKWDVYSAGVTILELFTGLPACPDSQLPREDWLCSAISEDRVPPPQPGLQADADRYRRLCYEVIEPCLVMDYRMRCTATELRSRLAALQEEERADHCDLLQHDWGQLQSAIHLARTPLGQGGFGCVYRIELCGRPVAVKNFVSRMRAEPPIDALHRQARLRHRHLLRLLGFAANPIDAQLCLVYEMCERGNLRSLIDDFGRHKEDPSSQFHLAGVRIRMAYELTCALDYLHRQPEDAASTSSGSAQRYFLMHQDVKSTNVLLTKDWCCKLGDLDCLQVATPGTSDPRTEAQPHLIGPSIQYSTPGYYVPGECWSCKVDVYALGVTLLELFTGREAKPSQGEELRLCLDGVDWREQLPPPQQRLEVSEACYRDLCENVFQICLVKTPLQRADSATVLRKIKSLYSSCR